MKLRLLAVKRKIIAIFKSLWPKIAVLLHISQQEKCEKLGKRTRQKQKLPEPSGLPVVGTLFEFIRMGSAPQLHEYISYRHKRLGEIFSERLGGNFNSPCVFVSSVRLMRKVFQVEGRYPRHPLPEAWNLYNHKHKTQRGLLFMDGSEWLHNRRMLSPLLLSASIDWIDEHIKECTEKLIETWREKVIKNEKTGTPFIVKNLELQLYRWAVDVICTIMFGSYPVRQRQDINAALDEFSVIVRKIFEASSVLMTFPPTIAKALNLRIWKNFESAVTEVLSKSSTIIELFMTLETDQCAGRNGDSLLSKLKKSSTMTPETIKRIFTDLVIAAGDTTVYTAEWALYLLSRDSALQARLASEALSVRSALLNGVFKETLRLYPVAPFVGRYLERDAVIGGYELKKDTLTLASLYTAGRDAEQFGPYPLEVRPERWLEGKMDGTARLYGTLPFAIGARSCIGRKVATNQILYLLSELLRNFELQCLNENPIKSVLRLVTVPEVPLKLSLKQRTSSF